MNSFLDPVELSLASKGLRFANYLIDLIIIRVFTFGIGFILGPFFLLSDDPTTYFISIIIDLIIFILFYSLQEYLFNGRTIGKFITGTQVVSIEGNEPDFGTYLLRSLCRLVPFEAFSFLGETGWHDAWSKTRVVIKRDFEQNKQKFNAIDLIGTNS